MSGEIAAKSRPTGTGRLKYVNRLIVLGLVLCGVLEYVHAKTFLAPAQDSFCAINAQLDCAAVAASNVSVFLGVPWALWGVVGFGAMLIASIQRSIWLLPLSVSAAVGSLVLLGLSLFKVGSLCYLCEAVHVITWLLAYQVVRGRHLLSKSYLNLNEASSVLAAPAGLALGIAIFLPNYWSAFTFRDAPPYPHGVTAEGWAWIGAEEPQVTVHEYVDYACPHCRAGSTQTLRRLGAHPDTRVVRRHQPRMRCDAERPSTCLYVRLALCAQEQGKFWQADRWLFSHVDVHKAPDMQKMSRDLKLDGAQFTSCVSKPETFERAAAEYKSAIRAGVKFVPGYTKDGKRLKPEEVTQLLR